MPSFAGVVLAAGMSSRMGQDKALLTVENEVLWKRQLRLLQEAGVEGPRYLSVREDQAWVPPENLRVVDREPDLGPIGGILSAMASCPGNHLAVVAVDLPRMPAEWFASLRAKCDFTTGAIGQHPDGRFEPLAAIYPPSFSRLAEAAIQGGQKSLQAMARRAIKENLLRVKAISPSETAWFQNWNTPDDLTSRSSP